MVGNAVVGVGAGGNAKVLIDALRKIGDYEICGLVDANAELKGTSVMGVPVLGPDAELIKLYAQGVRHAFMALASLSSTRNNKCIFDRVRGLGFKMINVIHPSAVIATEMQMGCGNRIFAGSIINPGTVLGSNVVINTGVIVDHDCRIADHAQIAPGAQLAGNVEVGEGSIIGIGASVIQGVHVGRYAMIGGGAVVLDDVPDDTTVVGVPARPIKGNSASKLR